MTHDPICPCHQQPNPASHWHDDGAACPGCECDLISTVRVNESAAYWRKANEAIDDLMIRPPKCASDHTWNHAVIAAKMAIILPVPAQP